MVITGKSTSYNLISVNIFHIISYYHLQDRKIIQAITLFFTFSMRTSVIIYAMENKKKNMPDRSLKLKDKDPFYSLYNYTFSKGTLPDAGHNI